MGREPICTWLDIKGGGLIRNTFVYNAILQDNLQLTREHSWMERLGNPADTSLLRWSASESHLRAIRSWLAEEDVITTDLICTCTSHSLNNVNRWLIVRYMAGGSLFLLLLLCYYEFCIFLANSVWLKCEWILRDVTRPNVVVVSTTPSPTRLQISVWGPWLQIIPGIPHRVQLISAITWMNRWVSQYRVSKWSHCECYLCWACVWFRTNTRCYITRSTNHYPWYPKDHRTAE